MSIVDEIIQLRDAGELNRKDGVELLQDLTSDQLREFAISELIDVELANRYNAESNQAQIVNANDVNKSIAKQRFPRGISANKSIETAEKVRNRGLLFEDGLQLPADLYSARDLKDKQRLGIDGPISLRPKSLVVGQTRFSNKAYDPLIDEGLGEQAKIIERTGALTEIVNDSDKRKLYDQWLRINNRSDNDSNRNEFVNFAQEYYGQELLRAADATPVPDNLRSAPVLNGVFGINERYGQRVPSELSTMGTDRLIESSVGLLAPEIDRAGDFRYMRDGKLRVGDNQATSDRFPPKVNILKAYYSPAPNLLEKRYEKSARDLVERGVLPTPDNVVGDLIPPQYRKRSAGNREFGARGGKLLSALDTFSDINEPIDMRYRRRSPSQYRYDDYMFTMSPTSSRIDVERGFIPTDALLVDNAKLNLILGQELQSRIKSNKDLTGVIPSPKKIVGPASAQSPKGKLISIDPEISLVRKAGQLLSENPRAMQILRFGGM